MSQDKSIEDRTGLILQKLGLIASILSELLEDPLFLDAIHGEQEMFLDLALDTFERIEGKFAPAAPKNPSRLLIKDDSYDAD